MSENILPAIDPNNPEEDSIKIDEKFLIKVENENSKITDKDCKILKIQSELDIDQILTIISTLNSSEYPNLFVFIIEHQNGNFLNENQETKARQLEEHLTKFGASRPLIIQQICETENKTKFYYKCENSSEIVDIDQHYDEDNELYEEWKNILSSFDKELQPFEDEMLIKLSNIKDSSIILRFLRTLNVPESFFETLVRYTAVKSKADLLAILDASFEDNGRVLSDQAQNYIQNVFEDDESDEEESDKVESDSEQLSDEELELEEPLDEDQQDSLVDETSSQTESEDSKKSVLLTAVQSSNLEIINYLITYWTDLIQKLPVDHQIRISTTAFDKNQLDVLSDLLEFSDFPFPKDLSFINNQLNHERLQKIITDRIKFHEAIEQENYKEIKDFIDNILSPKFVYSPQNITAIEKAVDKQKYKVYYYLKSFGLCASEFRNLKQVLDETELSSANDHANAQETELISDALRDSNKSVLILCSRSLIHNRKVKNDKVTLQKCIKKWLEDINKKAKDMLDVAASCENLIIIFDFESKFVDRTAFRDNTLGLSSDTVQSRIFIGAKLGDNKREQEIKGVLAHELCHYVMSLVYDNKFLPYYKHATDNRDWFDEIVKSIDMWSANDPEPPDDECGGIISSVFRYKKEEFNQELIVRAVQILVLYDDDSEKSTYLQEKYQELFDFWASLVLPELEKYLQKNKVVIRINTTVGLLSSLSKSKIEFSLSRDMEQLTKNRITIVTSNVPRLLFINIHKHFQENFGCLLDSQNIFIESDKIKNLQIWKDLNDLYAKDVILNVFVDCTKGNLDNLSSLLKFEEFKLILVASNEEQSTKLNEIYIKKETVDINYSWSDLTAESQIMLLQTGITFQNNPKVSIMEILSKNTNPDQNEVKKIVEDISNIINDQIFNLLVDKEDISVNSNFNDSNNINFEIMFRSRYFLKKGINFKNEISQEKLISITANQKHVLISDIAGSGKSWVVKNISKIIMQQDPTRWVTYVDLNRFIEEFKEQPKNCEFENFFIDKILKPKSEFEAEIFKKLYKIGKVSIIFDAFDEIAPDCAEFVADLAKLFEFNDGNHLWIVTRDYFEVNLQEKLEIDNVYKLNEFTEEDGIKFIVSSWILMDIKDQTVDNFKNCLQNSPNLAKYQEKAKKIVQKLATTKNQSIGLPQLFSMIADGFKDDKFMLDDLKGAKIFTKFVETMHKRMLTKGQLREDAIAESLDYELNFKELHQYFAILSLFPELVDVLFPDYDISEWPEVEIIAGGILNKFRSNYSFNHETFREYFVADFIFKAIKKSGIKKEIIDLLVNVLTIQKYGIIRMFLNDFIDNYSIMDKVQLELQKSVEKFNNMENLSEYFTENLEHLAKLVIEVLKKGNYENVRKILNKNISAVATNTKDLKIFSEFTEFLFSYLSLDDLKGMINNQNILHKMIGSDSNVEIFEYFVEKLDEKLGREFIQQKLKLMPSGPENGNIFYHLGISKNLNQHRVKKYLEIFQKYLTDSEIVELMEKCNEDGKSILEIFVKKPMNFKPFLEGTEYFLTNQTLLQKFKNIVNKTDSSGKNILHLSAAKEGIEFHTLLWKLTLKIFKNYEELKTFLFQADESKNNFLHILLKDVLLSSTHNKSEPMAFSIQKLKENLSESDYLETLRSKGQFGRNLLQRAANHSKSIKTHQILWKAFRDSCQSDEDFLELLREFDEGNHDILLIAVACTTGEVFEFMEKELEKLTSRDEIRKLFIKLGHENKNLLQVAARFNNSLEFNETLWRIIRKYFNSFEILEFVKNRDIHGYNLLVNVINFNSKRVSLLTWKEVKELLNSNDLITAENKENIQKCEKIIESSSEVNELQNYEIEILKLKWLKNENSKASKLFNEVNPRLVEQNLNINNIENFHFFVADENVENHEKLWENLLKIYKTRADLKKLFSEKDKNDNSFVHLLVIYNTADVIEFTLNKIKQNFSESDYQEILRSKGYVRKSLLQHAAGSSIEVKTHQILWKELRESCKSDEEFVKFLGKVDDLRCDVFNIAASYSTNEVFTFIITELKKIASRRKIRKILIKLGFKNRNLFQAAALDNNSLELHKTLWKIFRKYFTSSEILEFVNCANTSGDNLLTIAKKSNTKEIIELTWTEIKKVLTVLNTDTETGQRIERCERIIQRCSEVKDGEDDKDDKNELELLNLEWIKIPNSRSSKLFDELIQDILKNILNFETFEDLMPIVLNKNLSNHRILWDCLANANEKGQELAKLLIFKKQMNGDNFIHLLVAFNTADVIKFSINVLKEILNESDYHEILRSKGQFGRNLLQRAAVSSKEVKIHQFLWKLLRNSCKTDEEFFDILREVDDDGDNVLGLAVIFASRKKFKFMQKELEKTKLYGEIKKLLIHLGYGRRNLLQSAVIQNKSLDLHEALWDVIEKYFNYSEILQLIKHLDEFGRNVLLNAIKGNTKEVKILTWNKVRNILIKIGYKNNINFKKCEEIMKKDKKIRELTKEEKEVLKLDWIDSLNSAKLFEDNIQFIMQKDRSDISLKDLMPLIADEDVKKHKIIWKYLEEGLNNYGELTNLLFKKGKYGDNFIHFIMIYNNADVVEFTISKFKDILSESDFKEILGFKAYLHNNLLHAAAAHLTEVKTHQILWKELRNSCKSDEEFLKFLEKVDVHGNNFFHLAAAFTTSEVFEFMISELEKLTDNKEIIRNHDVQITPETSTLSYVRFEYKQILQSTLSCFRLNMMFIFG